VSGEMRFHVQSSGGFGNIRLQGSVDADDLPSELAQKLLSVLSGQAKASPDQSPPSQMCDGMTLEISVTDCDIPRQATIDQTTVAAEDWATCHGLLQEIVKRKTSG